MPNYNGTGPSGDGPMTGRGMGYCILKRDKNNSSITHGVTGLAGNYYQRGTQQQKKTDMPREISSYQTGMKTLHGYPASLYVNPAFPGPAGRAGYTPLPCRTGMMTYTGYPYMAWFRGNSRGRRRRHGCFFRF